MSSLLDLVDPVSEDDIEWISRVLRLRDLDAPRRDFLMSLDSMDVSACPGSGKTTLVVAKLAILARKWKSPTRGICVLSHTNVARKEIEGRLSGAGTGHLLLGYPHYIDTIHGFANRFLALPWLLSHGHAVTAIDDDVAAAVRRRIIGKDLYRLQAFLEKRSLSVEGLRLRTADFADPLGERGFPAGPHTPTYQIAARALTESARQGFFCHDEMLLFAEALLREHPEVANLLAQRFPFLILDEMQDTSARQARIIESALPFSRVASVHRVGDPNQAIYEDGDAETGQVFPDRSRRQVSLPNSFRFDGSIASRATRLAVEPVGSGGLQGLRPLMPNEPGSRHCIFVFPDDDTSQVLPAFASHVASVMDAAQVEDGSVIAIGEVHRLKEDIGAGHAKFPATVSHYWDGYHPDAAPKAARPKEFVRYMRAARTLMEGGRSAEATDVIASGIARMANMLGGPAAVRLGPRPHRGLERQLAGSPAALAAYRMLLLRAAPGAEDSEAQWKGTADAARLTVGTLLGVSPAKVSSGFLGWIPAHVNAGEGITVAPPGPNIYRVPAGRRTIDVQMGSIHSVKGETHFATLVLETFYYGHALKSLFPRLLGDHPGSTAAGKRKPAAARELRRLRMNYVALTRSTHVICLAVPDKSLGEAPQKASLISRLEAQGWRIVEIATAGMNDLHPTALRSPCPD
jgi:DNA helicase II / ATP-dependent DNA helicase PcrA